MTNSVLTYSDRNGAPISFCVLTAPAKQFKNVVSGDSLSDAKKKIDWDSSHALHTNNDFITNNNHYQNEKVIKTP